jgi:hypothetical protein
VDADGVPTLVEVKRASDTRIRREVVGQMLDYAANGTRYWPAAVLQRAFEATCAADGVSVDQAYAPLLDGQEPEEFWNAVEGRLAAGQVRLLFVADRIPLELRAVVEFLNRQMRQADVYAVELAQYRSGSGMRVLVPRVLGEVATAQKSPSSTSRRRWTLDDMDAAARQRYSPAVQRTARALLDHGAVKGSLISGEAASYPSMCGYFPVEGKPCAVWALSLYEDPAKGALSFSMQSIADKLGREAAAAFADDLSAVPVLKPKMDAARAADFRKWPTALLTDLAADPTSLQTVLTAVDNLMRPGIHP